MHNRAASGAVFWLGSHDNDTLKYFSDVLDHLSEYHSSMSSKFCRRYDYLPLSFARFW